MPVGKKASDAKISPHIQTCTSTGRTRIPLGDDQKSQSVRSKVEAESCIQAPSSKRQYLCISKAKKDSVLVLEFGNVKSYVGYGCQGGELPWLSRFPREGRRHR